MSNKLPCAQALKMPFGDFVFNKRSWGGEHQVDAAGLYWGECQRQVNLRQLKG